MQVDHYRIQRFPALSDLYFRLTDKTASDVSSEEMEEFLEAINESSPPSMSPEQFIA